MADDDFWDAELEAEARDEQEERRWSWASVLGTSYGLSAALHLGVLVVLATIVIALPAPREAKVTVIVPPAPRIEREPPPEAEAAMEDTPEVPIPEEVVEPVIELIEVPEPPDVSAGEPDNAANKDLQDRSFDDAYGPGGPPAGIVGRGDRKRAAARIGGVPQPRSKATADALRWLKRHQDPSGRWDADGWQRACDRGGCAGPDGGRGDKGGAGYDVGVTALALLAFLGDGHTPRWGAFKRVVKKGFGWLARQQRPDGSLGHVEGGHGGMYSHALATLALAECYLLERHPAWRRPAQRAVDFCLAAQNPGLAWKYQVKGGRNDTSVTGWMVLALKAARAAGLDVPSGAFSGALSWVERATDSQGRVGYESPGGGSSFLPETDGRYEQLPVLTAVGVLCRQLVGEGARDPAVRQGVQLLAAQPPAWEPRRVSFYYWYYGTYVAYQAGGRHWERWAEALLAALLPSQRRDACAHGSWDGVGEWCVAGGRVYATALAALTFEAWYRVERRETPATGSGR